MCFQIVVRMKLIGCCFLGVFAEADAVGSGGGIGGAIGGEMISVNYWSGSRHHENGIIEAGDDTTMLEGRRGFS